MNKIDEIAKDWTTSANSVSLELSKTLILVAATLLIFSAAIPVGDMVNNLPASRRIPWLLFLVSLMLGIGKHVLMTRRLYSHARNIRSGQPDRFLRNTYVGETGHLYLSSSVWWAEKWCIRLQIATLLLGLLLTAGILAL